MSINNNTKIKDTSTNVALKNDSEKPDLSILPLPALIEMTRAFMHGEKKYSRHNFRHGFETHRLVSAALRHLYAWESGENLDPESGASHLGHAMAALAMLVTNVAEGTAKDTRYVKTETADDRYDFTSDDYENKVCEFVLGRL